MKQYIVCVGEIEYVKNGWHETTSNSIYAQKFNDIETAAETAKTVELNTGKKTLIREFTISDPQEILEIVGDYLDKTLQDWAADIDISYKTNTISIFDPDGRKTHKLTLTTQYAD